MSSFKIKLGLLLLIFALACITFCCGSDNNAGGAASHQDKKLADKGKTKVQVRELLLTNKGGPGKAVKPGGAGSQIGEVTPGNKTGGLGISQQEIKAAIDAAAKVDPKTMVITPPTKAAKRGLTMRQLEALKPTQKIDPESIEVLPSAKPGEQGLTKRQLEALKPAQKIDPEAIEIIPPTAPGKSGLTKREFSEITKKQNDSANNVQFLPSTPPNVKTVK